MREIYVLTLNINSAKYLKNTYKLQIARASYTQQINPLPFGYIYDRLSELRRLVTLMRDDLLVRLTLYIL